MILLTFWFLITTGPSISFAQTFVSHPQFATAISSILISFLEKGRSGDSNHFENSTNSRQESIDDTKSNEDLFLASQRLRHDRLMLQAAKKNVLADQIENLIQDNSSEVNSNPEDKLTKLEEEFNKSQARLLRKESELLRQEVNRTGALIEHLDTSPNKQNSGKYCDIMKIGPLRFVPQVDEIRHLIDHDTEGQIRGETFGIFERETPKIIYFLESVDPFVKNIGDAPGCFEFKYDGMPQVLCANSIESRNSWIDALTEAWFCKNLKIKGTLPSIKLSEKVIKEKKSKSNPSNSKLKEKKKNKVEDDPNWVNIEIGLDENLRGQVKLNPKKI